MTSRNAYRLTNEHANPACAPARDILAAGVFPAPAARPGRDVADDAAPADQQTGCTGRPRRLEQKLRLALGIQAFTPDSTGSKGECGRIKITHI